MGSPIRLRNPIALTALSAVAIVRGVGYLTPHAPFTLPPGTPPDPGPSLPGLPVTVAGVVWVIMGLFLLASLFRWRWFPLAAGLTAGAYATWTVVYALDAVVSGNLLGLVSAAVYICLGVCTLTLAQEEVQKPTSKHLEQI